MGGSGESGSRGISSAAVKIDWSKNNEESIDSGKEEEEIGAKDSLGSTLPKWQFNVRHVKEGKSGITQISGLRNKNDDAV